MTQKNLEGVRETAWVLANAVVRQPPDPNPIFHWLTTGAGRQYVLDLAAALKGQHDRTENAYFAVGGIFLAALVSCLMSAWLHWLIGFGFWIMMWVGIAVLIWRRRKRKFLKELPACPVVDLSERRRLRE